MEYVPFARRRQWDVVAANMLRMFENFLTWRMIAVVPCLATIFLADMALHTGLMIPVPFILVLIMVIGAGAYGGFWAGLIAGLASSAFIIHAYLDDLGPGPLTGSLVNALFSCGVFLTVGVALGRLKDSQARALRALHRKEADLKSALSKETAEKDAHAALAHNRAQNLRRAVRVARVGDFSWDVKTGNCLYCSPLYAANFGLTPEEFVERSMGTAPFTDFIHKDDHASFNAAIAKVDRGEAIDTEYRVIRSDGKVRFIRQFAEPVFDEAGATVETVGCTIDLTDLREAEARVRQSQRIEAIGSLTGGVAHDFNNLLAVIMGNIELAMGQDLSVDQKEYLEQALAATRRGADLSKNLLSFARRAHLTPTRLNLNKHIQNTVSWGLRVLPENISIENSLMAGLWDAELDATSLDNAIINLILNARDAMPLGGKITIETANMRIGDEYVLERQEDIEPGRYVMLAITDTGHGITTDALEKIFEPFYTEKPVGQGSGLGLSMVHGFIKQSGGAIRVYSEIDVGTTFKLYFKATSIPHSPEPPVRAAALDSGHEGLKILVAEDEDAVRKVLCQMLEEAGFQVLLAPNGDEALRIFKAAEQVDLLMSDVVMPGMLQGPALAKKIRRINPDLPCIFLSGYAAEATVHGNGLKASDIRLMKPVSRNALIDAIHQAMKMRTTPKG